MNAALTLLRMFPEISPIANPDAMMTLTTTEPHSSSDDGSEVSADDKYFILKDNEMAQNDFDPTYVEEDQNYDNFLSGISFNYGDLHEQLTPPVNMYNDRGHV